MAGGARWFVGRSAGALGLAVLVAGIALRSEGEGARAATTSSLRFSDPPRDAEISRAALFAQPLVPVGATSENENRALAEIVVTYEQARRRGAEDEVAAPIESFLDAHPAMRPHHADWSTWLERSGR